MDSFKDKVAVVTGGAQGIGRWDMPGDSMA